MKTCKILFHSFSLLHSCISFFPGKAEWGAVAATGVTNTNDIKMGIQENHLMGAWRM
jgi:hypothetical protein